ncbi:hypothetical protein Leryth_015098 [Lithospermum erythrorhizon]|nr:hypothetical protein Leryth_015098 [Lithospermum erythrorhizon]
MYTITNSICRNSSLFNFPYQDHIFVPKTTELNIPKTSLKPLTLSNSEEIPLQKIQFPNQPTSFYHLPIGISNSGSVSRYFFYGDEVKLESFDENGVGFLDFWFDFQDGLRKLARICWFAGRDFFLPRVFSANYLEYVKWKLLHRVFSSALQVLATQAMFRAIGIGYLHSLPSAAALNWVLKDGLGRLSRCIYTASLASAFDTNLKRVRFLTSVMFSLSIGIEFLTPAFPHYFLLLASIANIAKQISLACYLATGVSFLFMLSE